MAALVDARACRLCSCRARTHRTNAACTATAAAATGCDAGRISRALAAFRGLPQRLEWFAMLDGRRLVNDSTATTPQSTIAALEALQGRVWLLVGGRDKGFDFDPLLAAIAGRAAGVALFGEVAGLLHQRLRPRGGRAVGGGRQHAGGARVVLAELAAWRRDRSFPQPVPATISSATSASAATRSYKW